MTTLTTTAEAAAGGLQNTGHVAGIDALRGMVEGVTGPHAPVHRLVDNMVPL